jgi:ADP-ribose pyrophosphatase
MSDDDLAWETLDSRIDYACPGFDVRMDDVRLPDGTETDFHYVEEVETVVVLPFVADSARADPDTPEVVCIEEWRQAVGRVNQGLPAGGVEGDDTDLHTAAVRELAEETGYEADSFERLCSVEPVNGIANSVHHVFVARGCRPTADRDLDFNESIRPVTRAYDDLLAAVRADEVRDGRTVLAVSRYELGDD